MTTLVRSKVKLLDGIADLALQYRKETGQMPTTAHITFQDPKDGPPVCFVNVDVRL